MPVTQKIHCPACDELLVRKPGGRCSHCGAEVAAHVESERERERRIEQVVAVIATLLVLAVFLMTAGLGLVEGVVAYAGAGALVWILARKTFAP
jgi:predicted nucleic acid-binding Zn ribbon protein